MIMSFCALFFPRDVLDEILDLIESVSEGFPTLMCLSIGTPKIINFPFVPNGKFIIFRCPKF